MRISSNSFYAAPLSGILNQQSSMATLNQQIASGNKLLTAADDPVAASQVMSLNDHIALSTQYQANQLSVSLVQKEEGILLDQLQTSLQSAQKLLTSVNASTDQNLKNSVAATLSGLYQQIKDVANAQDSNGNYIFAGFKSSTQPYDGTSYLGDGGLRQVQISQGQTIQANDNLNSVIQAGTASDLLQVIAQTAANLQNPATSQAQLDSAHATVNSALGKLQDIQVALVGRQQQVSSQQSAIQQLLTVNQDALGKLTQVDQASAIVELQMRQVSLQAAESAFASTSKLSLFNYL